MYRRIGLAIGAVCAITLSKLLVHHQLQCGGCGPASPDAVTELLVGGGLVTGLVLGLHWLETAPLHTLALHLTGLSLALTAVFMIAG